MVHKVHERLGNSVDSPLEGVEEVSQVHRVLYLHGGGGDDDHDDIYDNFDNDLSMVSFTPFISRWVECIAKLERVLSPWWEIIIMIIIITLGNIKKRLLKHITKFPTV